MVSAVENQGAGRTHDPSVVLLEGRIKDNYLTANQHRAVMLDAIGQFDEQGLAEAYGEKTTATWLRRELNLPDATTYEYVRVAKGLRRFRKLYAAFESGMMPYSTVRFLLRFLDEENEEDLVELALTLAFSDLELVLAGAGPKEDEPVEPYANARTRDDGMVALNALLPPVIGQQFLAALKIAQLAFHGLEDVSSSDLEDEEVVQSLLDVSARRRNRPG